MKKLKCFQKKRDSYYYTPTISGKTRWIPLGKDYAEALAKYHRLASGEIVGVTINQLLDNYIRSSDYTTDNLAINTIDRYERGIEMVRQAMGHLDAKEVNATTISRFIEHACEGSAVGNGWVSPLSNAYKRGIVDGLVETTPFRKGDIRYKKKPVRVRVVQREELEAIKAEMMDREHLKRWNGDVEAQVKANELFMEISMLTGLRAGDVLSINADSITEEGLVVKVQKRKKAHQALCFRWTPELRRWAEQVGDLFEPLSSNTMSHRFGRAAIRAGVENIVMHDIRRFVLQEAKRAGMDAAKIQGMAGHTNMRQTANYTLGVADVVDPLTTEDSTPVYEPPRNEVEELRPKLRLVR